MQFSIPVFAHLSSSSRLWSPVLFDMFWPSCNKYHSGTYLQGHAFRKSAWVMRCGRLRTLGRMFCTSMHAHTSINQVEHPLEDPCSLSQRTLFGVQSCMHSPPRIWATKLKVDALLVSMPFKHRSFVCLKVVRVKLMFKTRSLWYANHDSGPWHCAHMSLCVAKVEPICAGTHASWKGLKKDYVLQWEGEALRTLDSSILMIGSQELSTISKPIDYFHNRLCSNDF